MRTKGNLIVIQRSNWLPWTWFIWPHCIKHYIDNYILIKQIYYIYYSKTNKNHDKLKIYNGFDQQIKQRFWFKYSNKILCLPLNVVSKSFGSFVGVISVVAQLIKSMYLWLWFKSILLSQYFTVLIFKLPKPLIK